MLAQVRILDVLLTVQEREERAAMLSDAFTPPGSTAGEPPRTVLCSCGAPLLRLAVSNILGVFLA